MCGIVGFCSTERHVKRDIRAGFIDEALYIDANRGWESTGIAIVEASKEKEKAQVYKRALTGADFINTPFFNQQVMKNIEKYSIVLGHNRSATKGLVEDKNAHPFQHQHITLVHNGTIQNSMQLAPYDVAPKDLDVDSDRVAWAMANQGELPVLERASGGYVFAWHNAQDGTFNIARNNLKPLYFCYVKGENTMYFASEVTLLQHCLERREVRLEYFKVGDRKIRYMFPKVHHLYKFDPADLRKFTVRPFKPLSSKIGVIGSAQGGSGSQETTTQSPTMAGTPDTWENDSPVLSETDKADLATRRSLRKSGLPLTTAKKRDKASKLLAEVGYELGGVILFRPMEWLPYTSKKGKKDPNKYGLIIGRNGDGQNAVMYQMTEAKFKEYQSQIPVVTLAANVCTLANNQQAVVVVEHHRHKEMVLRRKKAKEERVEQDPPPRNWFGPQGQKVSLDRFMELTAAGCGFCDQFINPDDHEKIFWVSDRPLCLDCIANKETLQYLGIDPTILKPETRMH